MTIRSQPPLETTAGSGASSDRPIDIQPRLPRVVAGPGALARIGKIARGLGATRPLVFSDAGVRAAGHVDRACAALRAEGLAAELWDGVASDPTPDDVDRGVAAVRAHGSDLLIGLGGGSVLDCARAVNLVATNGGAITDYLHRARLVATALLPAIGVPTTAGTGSDAQSYALITAKGTRVKMACGAREALFDVAVLDADLPRTAPQSVAAAAVLDAIAHAVESHVATSATVFSRLFSAEAWRLASSSLAAALIDDRPEAWESLLIASHFAGVAIEHSMLGAAHASANPLTARFNTVHGVAVAIMLPHVVRHNAGDPQTARRYAELLAIADVGGCRTMAEAIESHRKIAGLPRTLGELGVPPGALPRLAEDADAQWTARYNPRPLGRREFEVLYAAAF